MVCADSGREKLIKIIFSDVPLDNPNGDGKMYAGRTDALTIPDTKACGGKPCFYADAGDTAVYKQKYRGGYWAEAYTVRDAEKYKKTDDGKSVDVVDIIKESASSADSDTLYVDSTFYDYFLVMN